MSDDKPTIKQRTTNLSDSFNVLADQGHAIASEFQDNGLPPPLGLMPGIKNARAVAVPVIETASEYVTAVFSLLGDMADVLQTHDDRIKFLVEKVGAQKAVIADQAEQLGKAANDD